jgi:hypothetical protein
MIDYGRLYSILPLSLFRILRKEYQPWSMGQIVQSSGVAWRVSLTTK